ncbi:MAG TPA: hypothetical protein VMH05_03950 [Bryobacteraceae bacterium]|nr:hypothetical protein [Bryobacteraceae bacterium]
MHGLLCDHTAFTASEASAGIVKGQKKFRPLPLAFFPQRKRFLYGVFFRVQPAAFNCAAGKGLLIFGKVYVH